jgi:hypothetical protein
MAIGVQILLGIIIVSTAVLVAALGIQVFQIFYEIRLVVKKINRILDDTRSLSETAVKPIAAVNNFFSEVTDLVKETQDEIISQTPDKVITPSSGSRLRFPKRFFHRSGLPLRPS